MASSGSLKSMALYPLHITYYRILSSNAFNLFAPLVWLTEPQRRCSQPKTHSWLRHLSLCAALPVHPQRSDWAARKEKVRGSQRTLERLLDSSGDCWSHSLLVSPLHRLIAIHVIGLHVDQN